MAYVEVLPDEALGDLGDSSVESSVVVVQLNADEDDGHHKLIT